MDIWPFQGPALSPSWPLEGPVLSISWPLGREPTALALGRIFQGHARLERQYSGFVAVASFAILTVVTWTMTCILSHHPVDASSYTSDLSYWLPKRLLGGRTSARDTVVYWYQATQVLEAIVDLLTIPVTSAVCVKAAMTFTQQQKHRVSARQAILLADRGWTSITSLLSIAVSRSLRKRSISSFFYCALALNCLGFLIAPLKQVLVNHRPVRIPTVDSDTRSNVRYADILDLFQSNNSSDSESLIGVVQDRIASTASSTYQPSLWSEDEAWGNSNYNKPSGNPIYNKPSGNPIHLALMGSNNAYFVSSVPTGTNTGYLTQYAPRINSSFEYQLLSETQLPDECSNEGWSLLRSYSGDSSALDVCMPGNQHLSPWIPTRDRQDISETVYMRVSPQHTKPTVFKISVHTTMGYFILPNYHLNPPKSHGARPHPPLEKVPPLRHATFDTKHGNHPIRGYYDGKGGYSNGQLLEYRTPKTKNVLYSTIESVINKGPLLLTILAMFDGMSSLPKDSETSQSHSRGACINPPPFGRSQRWDLTPAWCSQSDMIAFWANTLPQEHLTRFFTGFGVFFATEAWLIESFRDKPNLIVNSDTGKDTVVPSMSMSSMIAISILLGTFLCSLFGMAWYAFSVGHWASSLDSFAMMRLGAAAGDRLRLNLGKSADEVSVLDEMPCWVGDADPDAKTGRLCIGAEAPLSSRRMYAVT